MSPLLAPGRFFYFNKNHVPIHLGYTYFTTPQGEELREVGKLFSLPEAAGKLGLKEARTRVLCQQGRLPGALKVGRNWVIPEEAIEKYIPGKPGRPTQAEEVRKIIRGG